MWWARWLRKDRAGQASVKQLKELRSQWAAQAAGDKEAGDAVITYPAKSAEGQASPLRGRERNSDDRNTDEVIARDKVLKPTGTARWHSPSPQEEQGNAARRQHIRGSPGPLRAPRSGCESQLRGTLPGSTGRGRIAGDLLPLCPSGSLWEQDLGRFREP